MDASFSAPRIHAKYDGASSSTEFSNYWANADLLDADSANSLAVRRKLVSRSRYEVESNGYSDGMVQTHANYLVGTGPKLRMQTGSPGFNRTVETQWKAWTKKVFLRRKLWTMAHAKVQDGESIGVLKNNPNVRNPVTLDIAIYETEQCHTPQLPYGVEGYIDGIKFDEYGNPEYYDLLPQHPGSAFAHLNWTPIQIPAASVLHWFAMRRAGQHRGVPEFRSTLNVGAQGRRWREATIAAAETAADFSALIHTNMPPDDSADPISPMTTVGFEKRMMTALPMGWDVAQMKAEHPNSTYGEFNRAQIGEQGRPKSMPFNVAAADSSGYNYASGRLDHQTYFGAVDVERCDGDELVLEPAFEAWYEEAAIVFDWPRDRRLPAVPAHTFDWPKHPVADQKSEAVAIDSRLRNGSASLSDVYSDAGKDFEDHVEKMADDYGVTPEEMRKILLKTNLAGAATDEPAAGKPDEESDDEE